MLARAAARHPAPAAGASPHPHAAGTAGCRRLVVAIGGDLVLCAGAASTGPLRREFWAIWDRAAGRLWERSAGGPCLVLTPRRVSLGGGGVLVDLALDVDGEHADARGTIRLGDATHAFAGSALLLGDLGPTYDGIGTWCVGDGTDAEGRTVAWCFTAGSGSGAGAGTIWRAGVATACGPARFAGDLAGLAFPGAAEGLRCREEATYRWRDRFLWFGTACRQPFVRFGGALPGGVALREGVGVIGRCAPH